MPLITDANYIARTLGKKVFFKLQIMVFSGSPQNCIIVDNQDVKKVYIWYPEKFRLRSVLFKEMFDDMIDDGILQKFDDP